MRFSSLPGFITLRPEPRPDLGTFVLPQADETYISPAKQDISTLQRIGHFYFALTDEILEERVGFEVTGVLPPTVFGTAAITGPGHLSMDCRNGR